MIEGETPGAPAVAPDGASPAPAPSPDPGAPDAGQPVAGPPTAGTTPQSSWLRVLLRLWCLKSADARASGNPLAALIVLSVSCLSAWVAVDWWQRRPDPEFSVDGIPLLAWYVLAVLALAGLMRWRTRPRPAFGAMLVLVLAVVPVPLLLIGVVAFYLQQPWVWWAGVAALYLCVFFMRGLHAVTGRTKRSTALVAVLFVAAFMWSSDAADAIPDVWNPRDATAPGLASEDELAEREAALFEQADRIDAALEPVHRDATAASQAFFLGFAGVGDQKVFAQEIGLATRVLGERYHIGDRHLSLINDQRDLGRAPLASVTALNYALQGLAERMDTVNDVLFLSISSHGSQEPSIAVSNSGIPLTSLTAEDLEEALHESGIQWRVIFISACYAGGFIDALRDPKTIVITAAAKDRTSFGCSNDSDLTYFGEAFYRDALPGAKSLRDAFEAARKAIAEREHREHETPSNPQAYFGAEIEAKLGALDP
jgi:Peptidase C13 family